MSSPAQEQYGTFTSPHIGQPESNGSLPFTGTSPGLLLAVILIGAVVGGMGVFALAWSRRPR